MRKTSLVLAALLAVAGICVMLWPVFTGQRLQADTDEAVQSFLEERKPEQQYPELLAALQEYNRQLYAEKQCNLTDLEACEEPAADLTVYGIDEQFSKALDLVGDGHFVFGAENKYLLALRDVLKESVNDQYDYIDWWLYEATDDYTVWEADCTMKYCLKEPEALYDFITGTLKPVPVSSGESTSQQE